MNRGFRVAILADIHGNVHALEAVLADVAKQAPDRCILAGDLVMNGPHPAEALARITSMNIPAVMGNTDHEVILGTDPAANVPSLPDQALRRLARLCAAIERHFGRPQDVEWAWANGELFILQARPVTALPEPAPRTSKLQQLMASNFAELLPVRPYPLEMTTWGPELLRAAILVPIFSPIGLKVTSFEQLFVEEDGIVVRFRGGQPLRPTPRILLAPVRLVRLARRHDLARWRDDPRVAEVQSRARMLEARDLQALA